MKSTQGLVAFLDILGYQNFIDNNSVEKAVNILDNVFTGLKDAVIEDYRNSWILRAGEKDKRFKDVAIQTLSDSIILHFPIQGNNFPMNDWRTLLQTTRVIQRRLFDNGFPSRGAIASGDYFVRDLFLVGRPFMDAYRLSQSLEFVSTVMTQECFARFKSDSKAENVNWERFPGGVEFLAPLKANREEKLYCLCPLRTSEINTAIGRDVASLVRSSFWRHDKDVPACVEGKLNNTVKFWNYWICRKKEAGITASKGNKGR